MNEKDFSRFFNALHRSDLTPGIEPFPWQRRLLEQLASESWPKTIDVPTSAGKTAVIDIALFHLALEANKKPSERLAPRRIFFVVDRRLVVDEAYERACRIRKALGDALSGDHGILTQVARRLAKLGGEDMPLVVRRLRGGLPRERAFIGNPLQPAVVLSTVDQVGSRLLFRGYGVSEFMHPIHAALVGMDSLIVLDEAHLSKPFAQTLEWMRRYQDKGWTAQAVGRPAIMVEMTATPPVSHKAFRLERKDWEHRVLGKRLTCPKPAKLLAVKGDPDDREASTQALAEALAAEAKQLMACLHKSLWAPVVGIIANQVAVARAAFEILRREEEAETILLTGRVRPAERDELVDSYLPRMKAGRSDGANEQPLYVVATQTVEVGADLDFDGLVTECAALDALRQRFGRLNRLGHRESAPAVIVYLDLGKTPDSVYGASLRNTWKWLNDRAKKGRGQTRRVIDFGIDKLSKLLPKGEGLDALLTPSSPAPILMPAHVDMLVQTSPPPAVEPDIALYLHGVDAQLADVHIIWRADLPESLTPEPAELAIDTVSVSPPTQQEAVAVPVWAVKAFLCLRAEAALADVEGTGHGGNGVASGPFRYALRWRGTDESELVQPDQVRPGDTLVIPVSYGGMDRFGWLPQGQEPVQDIGDAAVRAERGVIQLRVHPALIPTWFPGEVILEQIASATHALSEILNRYRDGEDLSELCDELLERLLELEGIKPEVREILQVITSNRWQIAYPSGFPQGILLRERPNRREEFTDEDDSSSLTREVWLEEHCIGVGALARDYALGCGLTTLAEDIALAGKLHDTGKADHRFQAWLWGGNRFVARNNGQLLAKSGRLVNTDRFAMRLAREQARYPQGGRHECYSVAMCLANPALLEGMKHSDLVLYLVGTHHGRGRCFMPAVEDGGMRPISFSFDSRTVAFSGRHGQELLDSGWAERFWNLVKKYGYWGLAYLETLVRLADHRRSEEGH